MLLILAAFAVIAYKSDDGNLISPRFLLCVALIASYCIVLFNYGNWDVHINGKFVLYVSTAVAAWILGGALVKMLMRKKAAIIAGGRLPLYAANIKYKYPVNVFMLLSVALTAVYVLKLLSDAGGGSLAERLRSIYDNTVENGYTPGFIFNQMLEIAIAVAYVNTFRLFQRIFSRHDKISIVKLLIPIAMFLIAVLVTTDRNILLRYAIYLACLYALFFYENRRFKNMNAAILRRVAVMVIIVVIAFFVMGLAKQYKSSFFDSLSIYGGSGLYNFNLWLENTGSGSTGGGSETFGTFIRVVGNLLGRIGIKLDISYVGRFDEFITFQSPTGYVYRSNIYSALKPFVADLGYFGAIFFPFLLGMFYQWLYLRAKRYKYKFSWAIYCMLLYPIIFFPILEQLFNRFTLGFVYELAWLAIIYYSVYGGRRYRRMSNKVAVKTVQGVEARS